MTYVKADCGSYLRISTVREFRYEGPLSVTLELDNGAQRKTSRESWDEALRCDRWERIPALPGTFLLVVTSPGGGPIQIAPEPILAWALDGFGYSYAVTLLGVHSNPDEFPVILFPDGTVRDPERCFDSYDRWLQEQRPSERVSATEAEVPKGTIK
jgi:hypothetical protein